MRTDFIKPARPSAKPGLEFTTDPACALGLESCVQTKLFSHNWERWEPHTVGWKASVIMEELGLDYEVKAIDISTNVQKEEWFTKVNANGRIRAIGKYQPSLTKI